MLIHVSPFADIIDNRVGGEVEQIDSIDIIEGIQCIRNLSEWLILVSNSEFEILVL